ncbi:hypothetical protein EDD21DRAFT_362859 [Dissophora ornata]|nr:hypothetical protein EDD21DRAFT_362859 [Dissophora ornata]
MTKLYMANSLRQPLKYGILAAVGLLGSAQLLYYFGWAGRLSALANQTPLEAILESQPLDTIETDRACVLLDRSFTSATQPDFTRSGIRQWTECRTLNNTASGWTVQHCTTPGSNPTQKEAESTIEPPSCYPGGYFRIQRLQPPAGEGTLQSGTCYLKKGSALAEDPAANQYAASFLGPDAFRIVLVGPERLSLMQQQSLGNCTYAIPYLISRPGRFWVQKLIHTYQGYDALNENTDEQWLPEYLGRDLLLQDKGHQKEHYHFDVCPHCVSWVAIDEATGLGGTQDICSRSPNLQSRQYGIYTARLPVESVRQAVSHPYQWIPARPRCRFYPALNAFESITESDSDEVKTDKAEATKCLQNSRSIYFVGDTHVRNLFSGVMQRLQGRSGGIDMPIQDRRSHTLKAGNVEARWDYDATLNDTLARIYYTLYGEEENPVPDLGVLDGMDTIVLGFGSFSEHLPTTEYMERVWEVLDGLSEIWKLRRTAEEDDYDTLDSLKVIWMGAPAWTENIQGIADKWKTNHRILYWNKLADGMVDRVNAQVGEQGIVDRLSGFEITVPFKNATLDNLHYTSETPIDSFSAELIHKLDLCS